MIPENWAADRAAKLVLLEHGARLAVFFHEEIVRVERVVAKKLPELAVECVRAGFADEIDVAAGAATVAGVVHSGLHFEFGDRVGIRDGDAGLRRESFSGERVL